MGTHGKPWPALGLCAALSAYPARADGLATSALEEVVISASGEQGPAAPDSASAGLVSAAELANRPLLRPGEVLEAIPGLVVTQHSGDGKANQYFLRGFDLDHGTDFATSVDGVPVNMPSHAHGQGYSDLNFVIPELIDEVRYRKGLYYADAGDFSAAGSAELALRSRLEQSFLSVSAGEYGYARALAAGSSRLGGGDLLVAAQARYRNGPWVLPEGYRNIGGVLKYTLGDRSAGLALEGIGYSGRWRATDQIPLRAVADGALSRFGYLDASDGGTTHRYGLSADGWRQLGHGALRANLYAIDYFLDLFSDFTYFVDPAHGDQFEQYDRRHVYGGSLEWQQPLGSGSRPGALRAGLQIRDDEIDPVALYDTSGRVRWKTVSETRVSEWHYAGWLACSTYLADWGRMELGARLDAFRFDVHANLPVNSGTVRATVTSPKASFAFGPWKATELYLDAGRGFHSNDARGTTLTVDPSDGTRVSRVNAVARALGAEVGARTRLVPRLELSASLWTLKLDSELTLDSDASAVVPSPATRRYGLELAALYRPYEAVLVDADLAFTHAGYLGHPAAGRYLPNSLRRVASLAVGVDRGSGWFGGAQLRYLGAAPITPDGSVRSHSSLRVSADPGYHSGGALAASVSVYNIFNRHDEDIAYYYASRLPGESAPVDDVHFHPAEPRTLRATLTYRF